MFVQFSFIFIAHITLIDGVPGQRTMNRQLFTIYCMPLLANDNRIAIDSTMCARFNCFGTNERFPMHSNREDSFSHISI